MERTISQLARPGVVIKSLYSLKIQRNYVWNEETGTYFVPKPGIVPGKHARCDVQTIPEGAYAIIAERKLSNFERKRNIRHIITPYGEWSTLLCWDKCNPRWAVATPDEMTTENKSYMQLMLTLQQR